jgi:hypothetical protein
MLRDTLHFRIRERFLGKMKWLGDEENCIMQTFKINTMYFSPNGWAICLEKMRNLCKILIGKTTRERFN